MSDAKYQGLQLLASTLKILAWVVGAVGFVSSIFLGIAASSLVPKMFMLLGGLLFTAITTGVLLAISEVIYLFIDIAQDIRKIAGKTSGPGTGL